MQLQQALCHAFSCIWPCSRVQVAVELAFVVIEIDTPEGDALPCSTSSRDGVASEISLPVLPSHNTNTVLGRQGNTLLEVFCAGLGIYYSSLSAPYDWSKNTRIFSDGFAVVGPQSGRELISCHIHAQPDTVMERYGWGVEEFRQLICEAPIAVEVLSGCYAPLGRAGPQPWELDHVNFEGAEIDLVNSFKGENIHGEDADVQHQTPAPMPSMKFSSLSMRHCNLLSSWLDFCAQPPRMQFIKVDLKVELHMQLWPGALAMLAAVQVRHDGSDSPLAIVADYEDANFDDVAATAVFAQLPALEVSVQDQTGKGVSVTANVLEGVRVSLEPVAKHICSLSNMAFVLNATLKGGIAKCQTSRRELRPVLGFTECIELDVKTPYPERELRCTRVALVCRRRHMHRLLLDISPQLRLVALAIAKEVEEVRRDLPGHSKEYSGQEKEPAVDRANSRRSIIACGSQPTHKIEIHLDIDPVTVNLCDAISALLRVSLTPWVLVKMDLGPAPWHKVLNLTGNVEVVGITGEFASQKEDHWEPFLEPWNIRMCIEHVEGVRTLIEVDDSVSHEKQRHMDADCLHGLEAPLAGNSRSLEQASLRSDSLRSDTSMPVTTRLAAAPMLLNFATQLVRSVVCLSNQFEGADQSDSALSSEAQLPACMGSQLDGIDRKSNPDIARDAPRIAALNLTGHDVWTWFHNGRDLRKARGHAESMHWSLDPDSRSTAAT